MRLYNIIEKRTTKRPYSQRSQLYKTNPINDVSNHAHGVDVYRWPPCQNAASLFIS